MLKRHLGDDGLVKQLEKKLRPLTVPPSEIAKVPSRALETFRNKHGLVRVCCDVTPRHDRFRSGKMQSDALSTIHSCFGKQGCWNATMAYDDPLNPVESAELPPVMMFGFRPFTKARSEAGQFEMRLQAHVEEKADEDSEDDDVHKQARDPVKVYVFDRAYSTRKNPDGKILAAVCHPKVKAVHEHLLQAGDCALEDLLHTTEGLDKGYRPPVYLEVWDTLTWYYGILEVDYFVQIKGGKVTEASLQQFPKEKSGPINDFTQTFTQSDVEGLLSKWKENLGDEANLIAEDRRYPVGRMFMRRTRFPMPSHYEEALELTGGAKKFYEGNLKILVGNEVCEWTSSDVVRAFYSRDEEQKRLHDLVGAPEWVKEALYPSPVIP